MKLLLNENTKALHNEMITGLCSNSNLNCLASVSDDKQLVVWDTKGQALSQFGS